MRRLPFKILCDPLLIVNLYRAFQSILDQDLGPTEAPRVGILTAVNRDLWSSVRSSLAASAFRSPKLLNLSRTL